jgi:hypothetical protein
VASPSFDLNTSAGRRIARTLAAQDAGEAEDIGERVARQKQQAREQGLWTGGRRRFGFEPDGMTLRPAEADAIRDAARRNLSGESARAVFRKWNTEGLYTTTGRPWDGSKYFQMMLRPCNTAKVGKLPRGTTKIREIIDKQPDAQWEKILDRETYLALAYKLTDPDRRTNYGTSQVLVGAGLYQCACGLTMRSGGLASNGKPRYQCGNVHGRTAEKVDRYVLAVTERVLTREGADLLPPAPDLTPLYERRAALRGRSEEIAADYADLSSGMTRDQFKIANAKVQREIAAVEAEIERHTGGSALTGVADAPDPAAAFRSATIERQRAVIGALMAVTLHRTGRGRRLFDPESVQIEPKQ